MEALEKFLIGMRCVLRDQVLLCKYQARWHPAHADCCRQSVSLQPSERNDRRIHRLVQADRSSLLYYVYADNAPHDGIDHDAVASASRSRRYAVGK